MEGFKLKYYLNLNWLQSAAVVVVVICMISSNFVMVESASEHHDYLNSSTSITLSLISLLPPTHTLSCTPSLQGSGRSGPSLEVRHKYGPCSPLKSRKHRGPTYKEIAENDGARVESIRNRIHPKKMVDTSGMGIDKNDVTLPARSGQSIGSGNYVITVGLGTPRKDLTLIFDTGSDFTWTQCEPCAGNNCYEQEEPKFDPSKSSTYANIACSSSLCTNLASEGGVLTGCSSSSPNCVYKVGYGDTSFSQGFVSNDTFYLGSGSQHIVPNYLFGCGNLNKGLFKGAAGLIGLSTSKLSLLAQSAFDYFSYCLPPQPSSTGYLTFGKGQPTATRGMQYTPLLKRSPTGGVDPNLYMIELQGIQVDGKELTISPTVFSTAGTIIDSGTVITRLPPDAYTALKEAFTDGMSSYPKLPTAQGDFFDTCFNFTGYDNVTIPGISLLFGGGAHMDLPFGAILIQVDNDYQYCLAFATSSDVVILGNTQQLGFDIVYDIVGAKLGFATSPNGCA